MKNHFDKNGNYINVENLSLAEIYNRGYQDGSEDGLKDIRPNGKWTRIPCKYVIWQCSNCNNFSENWTSFCCWCGADMRGGDNHVAI